MPRFGHPATIRAASRGRIADPAGCSFAADRDSIDQGVGTRISGRPTINSDAARSRGKPQTSPRSCRKAMRPQADHWGAGGRWAELFDGAQVLDLAGPANHVSARAVVEALHTARTDFVRHYLFQVYGFGGYAPHNDPNTAVFGGDVDPARGRGAERADRTARRTLPGTGRTGQDPSLRGNTGEHLLSQIGV